MKKLEDWKLPEVGSERVKQCMQDAVERALQLYRDNEVSGEYTITVGNLTGIFHDLSSDCDFGNKACINSKFKKIIDKVYDDITANEVLDILNDAYAIAIHAANKDFPEYEIRDYRAKADKPSRSTHARDMVLAFGAFLLKECAQSDYTLDIYKSTFASEIYTTLIGLNSLNVFYEEGPEYDLQEQKDLDNLIKRLNPPPHPVEPLIDAIVRYAEALSSDEQSAIRAIGRMLHAKGAAGRYIPTKVYQKYEQRIDNLANYTEPEHGAKDNNEEKNTAKNENTTNDVVEPDADEKDNKIRAAITKLMEIKNNKVEKKQWYAVYKVLCSRQLYTKNMKSFANDLEKWVVANNVYESLKVSTNLPDDVYQWRDKLASATRADKKLIDTSILFQQCLR